MSSSTDPIRPVGRVDGEVYVGRAELPARVTRRARPEEDPGEHRGGHHHHHRDGSGPGEQARQPTLEELDAGAYDDHGRPAIPDDVPPHPHFDATA